MSSEATIRSGLQIVNGNLKYTQPSQGQFQADMSLNSQKLILAGPTPGMVLASTSHTEPDFTQINNAGGFTSLCFLANLDTENFVEYGLYDSTINKFLPLGELLPGEGYTIRLSRYLGKGLTTGIGTGTSGTDVIKFSLKADVAACQVIVDCFAL